MQNRQTSSVADLRRLLISGLSVFALGAGVTMIPVHVAVAAECALNNGTAGVSNPANDRTLACGGDSDLIAEGSTAVGSDGNNDNQGTIANGFGATAIGSDAQAGSIATSANGATAVGGSEINDGIGANATGVDSTAIGSDLLANATGATALGANVKRPAAVPSLLVVDQAQRRQAELLV